MLQFVPLGIYRLYWGSGFQRRKTTFQAQDAIEAAAQDLYYL